MNHRRLAFSIAAAIFAVDQLLKYLVTGPWGLSFEGDQIVLLPIFNLTMVYNQGISLGLMQAGSDTQRWVLVAVTGGIAAFVTRWLWSETNRQDCIGLAMILGGALGNILDRIRLGHVTDFLDLHFGEFRPFLVFNIADAAITVGVLILLARALLSRDSKPKHIEAENENA
jgi:signal peptidase II